MKHPLQTSCYIVPRWNEDLERAEYWDDLTSCWESFEETKYGNYNKKQFDSQEWYNRIIAKYEDTWAEPFDGIEDNMIEITVKLEHIDTMEAAVEFVEIGIKYAAICKYRADNNIHRRVLTASEIDAAFCGITVNGEKIG